MEFYSFLLLLFSLFSSPINQSVSVLSCVYFPFSRVGRRRSLNLMKVGTWMRSTPLVWCYYSWAQRSCYYFKSILCLPVPVSSLLFRTYSNNAVSQNCIQSFKCIFFKATHGKEKESPIGNKTAADVFFFWWWRGDLTGSLIVFVSLTLTSCYANCKTSSTMISREDRAIQQLAVDV